MPVFAWTGTTISGEVRSGEMKATSLQEVQDRLRRQDINPSKVKKKRDPSGFKFGGGVPLKTLVVFTRQFATMIDAGLPLVQCLELLGGAEPHAGFKKILAQVRADIESGSTLADAMAKHTGDFDNLYVSLIAADEADGILDKIMKQQAKLIETSGYFCRNLLFA